MSPDPESNTTGTMTGSRPEPESSGDAASKANSKSSSKASKETSSTPLVYLEASLGGNEDMSLITDTKRVEIYNPRDRFVENGGRHEND